MIKEFKKFLLRGNVIDLAVGIIIGGAFQSIVTTLVEQIINPILSIFLTKVDFKSLTFAIPNTAAVIGYGEFITAVINFLIMGTVVFFIVKVCNKMANVNKKEATQEAPTTKVCPYCFSEINIKATKCAKCTSDVE